MPKPAQGIPLDFKVYLEGIQVPVNQIVVTSTMGSPASAVLTVLATNKALDIQPRTSVHIFYLDPHENYTSDYGADFADRPVYRMLFEGEIVAIGFEKTTQSRQMILQCLDISNNFDYAHKFIIEGIDPLINSQFYSVAAGSDPVSDFDGDGSPITLTIAKFVTGQSTLAEGIRELVKATFSGTSKEIKSNAFLRNVQSRFKISNKVFALPDSDVVKLVAVKRLEDVMARSLQKHSPVYTLTELINDFLTYIQYQKSSVLAPAYKNNTFNSIVFTPKTWFTAPPKCNVLFPDMIRNIGYQDNFLQMPTRMLMQAGPFSFNKNEAQNKILAATTYLAPSELAGLLPTGSRGSSKPNLDYASKLTGEERIKGIVPVFRVLTQPEFIAQLSSKQDGPETAPGKESNSSRNYLLNLAEYEYETRRAMTRQVSSMSGPFNPEVVIGAPALVMDSIFFIFGMLQTVTHSISSDPMVGSSTTYQLSMARRLPVKSFPVDVSNQEIKSVIQSVGSKLKKIKESEDPIDLTSDIEKLSDLDADLRVIEILSGISKSAKDERSGLISSYFELINNGRYEQLPKLPRWFNSKFYPENVGSAYQELYGIDSIMEPPKQIEGVTKYKNMSQAAKDLYFLHRNTEDPFVFSKSYTKRRGIVTEADFVRHYSLTPLKNDEINYPARGPFTKSRQVKIIAYVNELILDRAHLG
jgi:hypothetical protein